MLNEENRNPDLLDGVMPDPCPNCNSKLMTLRNKDGTNLPETTQMIIYCTECDFEEYMEQWGLRDHLPWKCIGI
jgi:hypothetical protein